MRLYTADKTEVEVPNWADKYEVGDDIAYLNHRTEEVEIATVLGFSTRDDIPALPVIEPPEGFEANEIAVDEEYHYSKDDLK